MRRLTVLHKLLLSIALLAFVVRSLVPVGFMPGQNGTHSFVICSGYGPVTIQVPADKIPHAPEQPGHDSHEHMPCSFAQALAHGIPVDIAALPAVAFITDTPESWSDNFNSIFISKGYHSQGPPSFLI